MQISEKTDERSPRYLKTDYETGIDMGDYIGPPRIYRGPKKEKMIKVNMSTLM